EDDVKTFFEQYSEAIFPEEAAQLEEGELLDYESFKEDTREVFIQQEVSTARGPWLEQLKEESKIQDNITEESSYRFLGATRNIIKNIFDELNSNESNTEAEITDDTQE
ncbi:MAG: PpiC-type peptidyl-prolyl cis-trans isomerase, partial [candidate division WS6 bacterium 34_10]